MACRRFSPAMRSPRASATTSFLASFLLLRSLLLLVSAQGSTSSFQTLSGEAPKVIAKGGFSGLFPDSTDAAYRFALATSLPDALLWCDVQLTSDLFGICAPDVNLRNSTNIAYVYPGREKVYLVNGVPTKGYFSIDFSVNELPNVSVVQGVYSRSNRFDGNGFSIVSVDMLPGYKAPGIWLNVQHDIFFRQHNLSMRSYIISVSKQVVINYISSPEVGFLKSIAGRLPNITKFVFRVLDTTEKEPSTNQTYDSLLSNLTFIRTFASGILLSKARIWPVDGSGYLQSHSSIVSNAHKAGLEVFASDFFNDVPLSYNYSYDPVTEALKYVDNGDFSVDGILSDFPITPSSAIGCFSHQVRNASKKVNVLVITKNGASGDYPGCTDLAYQNAISDEADVIDCPVQISKDGVPFCLASINLYEGTTVAQSKFSNLAIKIPELTSGSGIFAFNLTWSDIRTLKPAMANPYSVYELFRNPNFKNAGNLVSLSEFLALAKTASSLTGVLISIENAPYLIEKQGLPVVDAVLKALSNASYNNQTDKKVMIQSSNSSVLMKFKGQGKYELVYKVDEDIGGTDKLAIEDIKQFAQSVVIKKTSVFPDESLYLTGASDVVQKLLSANLPVYVETFSNEFVSQAWDFFSDPTVEINTYVLQANISGVITDFPRTSSRYTRNRCLDDPRNTPSYMSPVQPGSLMQVITPDFLPPAEAPYPILEPSDITESPLPSVVPNVPSPNSGSGGTAAAAPSPNGQHKMSACVFMSSIVAIVTSLLLH